MVNAIVQNLRPAARAMRRPRHNFQIIARPWSIVPIMNAPVLPGETMKNLLLQSRVVTDPIRNKLVGWWQEYYFFYVKLRDLDGRADFTEMFVDNSKSLSAYDEAAAIGWYHADRINWTRLATKRIVEEYFRDEGEAWDIVTHGGFNYPVASVNTDNWMQSLHQGADVDAVDPTLTVGGDGLITGSEVEFLQLSWQLARQQGLTQMSYDQYLEQYGVKNAVPEEPHRPELIRYTREWQYPSNTINPANGAPTSAVSWSIADRADKARYFKEPGFIIGLSVTRPKTYFRNAVGSLSSFMEKAQHWLPAMFMHDAGISWIEFASGAGPAPEITQAYHADVRDLLKYGDQFYNFTDTQEMSGVELPAADGDHKYPTATMAQQLFVDDATSAFYVRQDGVVALGIESHVRDLSPVAPQT